MSDKINFNELFEGFQNTPLLWNNSEVYELEQLLINNISTHFSNNYKSKKLRLGKWVENFVSFQLQHDSHIKIIEENLQIKSNKITIGELDLLLLKDKHPIHLEIIYKFYLYDNTNNYANELSHWIGPNKNDALVYKLNKLKEKQLPLLHHPRTRHALEKYPFDINSIKQQVCFKAQLFLPYDDKDLNVSPINTSCVVGWYLNIERISELENFEFYIPEKLEWLCQPKENLNWLPFIEAKNKIDIYITNNRSPLCWLKNENNILQKCFITWW